MHTQGQAQATAIARQGLAPAIPGDLRVRGTARVHSARRPRRRLFRGEPGHVPLVRDFVRRYLSGCDCPEEAVDDILSCATELAANAVLHSRSGLPGGHFSVEVAFCAEQRVHVSVEDSGGPWAARSAGDADAESGRGLHIVSALSADMGITGDASGRTAWFCRPWSARADGRPASGASGRWAVHGRMARS